MKIKKIYAKKDFKVNRYNCYLYDKELLNIKNKLDKNMCEELSSIINLILLSDNITNLSYSINLLINYNPINNIEKQLLLEALGCISIKLNNKKLDIKKYILNKTYNYDLREASYYSDNNDLSKSIVNIPFESSLRIRN